MVCCGNNENIIALRIVLLSYINQTKYLLSNGSNVNTLDQVGTLRCYKKPPQYQNIL